MWLSLVLYYLAPPEEDGRKAPTGRYVMIGARRCNGIYEYMYVLVIRTRTWKQ